MDALDIEKWRFVSDRYGNSGEYRTVNCILYSLHVSLFLVYIFDLHCFVLNSPGTSVAASSILMGLVMLGRAAFVFPLSFLSNLSKKNQSEKIDIKQQVLTIYFCSIGFTFLWRMLNAYSSTGCDLVGWSNERCCIYGSCLQ